MLVTSHKKGTIPDTEKKSCLQMLKYSFNFEYTIEPVKYSLQISINVH